MSFTFQPVWDLPIAIAVVVATIALVLWTYPKRVQHHSRGIQRLLIGLRLTTILVLSIALFRPAVQFSSEEKEPGEYLVLADATRSMSIQDSAGGKTRRELLHESAQLISDHVNADEELNLSLYNFTTEPTTAEQISAEETSGQQTSLGGALKWTKQQSLKRNIKAVLLLSDGAQRAVSPFDIDPLTEAMQLGAGYVRVHTVPFGSTGFADNVSDLAIQDLQISEVGYEKKAVPMKVRVRAVGTAGQKIRVRVLVEDRRGVKLGDAGPMVAAVAQESAQPFADIIVEEDSQIIPVDLTWFPEMPGEYKLAVEAIPLEGELQKSNNIKQTMVTILKGGVRVAYIDRHRPENRSIRLVGSAQKIQIDTFMVISGKLIKRARIPKSIFEPQEYDVFILGDVPADLIGKTALQKLQDRVNEGAGLLMVGGLQSFGGGGYAGTPLEEVLPIEMDLSEKQIESRLNAQLHFTKKVQMLPTDAGLFHYIMQIGGADNLTTWKNLPPLNGANKIIPKSDFAEVLAIDQDQHPLLISQDYGAGRVLAFAGDTTWQWFQDLKEDFRDETQRFWHQMVLWLAHKEQDTDQPVWVKAIPRIISAGQKTKFQFGARDENGNEVTEGVVFQVKVKLPNGQMVEVTPRQQNKKQFAEFSKTGTSGDYWVQVQAIRDGRPSGYAAWGRFQVEEIDLELDNPAADPGMLEQISSATGGTHVKPEDLADFLARLEKIEQEGEQIETIRLWDNWWFLLLFVLLMSSEWTLRKIKGLV